MRYPQVLAVIPARSGSKGLPRKNLRPLAGAPLIAWAIRAAQGAKRVTRSVVTTDDDEIAEVSRREGAEILMRPRELAGDDAPMGPVLLHALDSIEKQGDTFDALVLTDPTSPFRLPRHIDECIEKLANGATQSVVTVTQLERNPFNIFAVDDDYARRFIEVPTLTFTSRQEFRHLKRINGCVYATWTKNIRQGLLIVDPVRVVEMPPEESINIDSWLDFALAERCASQLTDRRPT